MAGFAFGNQNGNGAFGGGVLTQHPLPSSDPVLLGPDGKPLRGRDKDDRAIGLALPHALTFIARQTGGFGTYWHDRFDECLRFNREYAETMRNDGFLSGLLQERMLAVYALRHSWHLEIPDERDAFQVRVRDATTALLKGIRFFGRLLWCWLDALWYGKNAAQVQWGWTRSPDPNKQKALTVLDWMPVQGDKIGHQFLDQQTGKYVEIPYVLIDSGHANELRQNGAEIVITTLGQALLLKGGWRERFIVHKHLTEDSDWFFSDKAEAIHGVGIRSKIFWSNWLKWEWMANITDFFDRVGLGITVWKYPQGNANALAAVKQAANDQSQRAHIFVPIAPDSGKESSGIERVEVPTTGSNFLREMIEYLDKIMERYVVGQEASSKGTSAGLGNEATADLQAETKRKITLLDADFLAETITGSPREPGLIDTIVRYTYPEADFPVLFRFDLESGESEKKLTAVKTVVEMGLDVKADQVRRAAGLSKPVKGDEVVKGQQKPPGGMPGAPSGAPGGPEGGGAPSGIPQPGESGASIQGGGGEEEGNAPPTAGAEPEEEPAAGAELEGESQETAPEPARGGFLDALRHSRDDRPVRVTDGERLIDLPDCPQPDDFSCGACCAMAVGRYFGVGPERLEDWKKALGTNVKDSTRPAAIIGYLSSLGLHVEARHGLSIADLAGYWRRGMPVICPIQEYGVPSKQASYHYGHYVVSVGVGLGQIFVFDPSIDNVLRGEDADQTPGRMMIDEVKWLEVWHDRDVDGNKFVRFGIAVGPPQNNGDEPDSRPFARDEPPMQFNARAQWTQSGGVSPKTGRPYSPQRWVNPATGEARYFPKGVNPNERPPRGKQGEGAGGSAPKTAPAEKSKATAEKPAAAATAPGSAVENQPATKASAPKGAAARLEGRVKELASQITGMGAEVAAPHVEKLAGQLVRMKAGELRALGEELGWGELKGSKIEMARQIADSELRGYYGQAKEPEGGEAASQTADQSESPTSTPKFRVVDGQVRARVDANLHPLAKQHLKAIAARIAADTSLTAQQRMSVFQQAESALASLSEEQLQRVDPARATWKRKPKALPAPVEEETGAEETPPTEAPAETPSGTATREASQLILRQMPKLPVHSLADLREQMPPALQGEAFDRAVLQLADEGKVALAQDAHPDSFTDEQKRKLVRDGGALFTTITGLGDESAPSAEENAQPAPVAPEPAPAKENNEPSALASRKKWEKINGPLDNWRAKVAKAQAMIAHRAKTAGKKQRKPKQ